MRTKWRSIAVLVALGLCVPWGTAVADKGAMRIQFGLLYNSSTDQLDGDGATLEVDDGVGAQLSFEYRITDLIGVEPALAFAPHDIEIESMSGEEKAVSL